MLVCGVVAPCFPGPLNGSRAAQLHACPLNKLACVENQGVGTHKPFKDLDTWEAWDQGAGLISVSSHAL